MAMNEWDRVAIVGVGLIGGSVGMALRDRRLAGEVVDQFDLPIEGAVVAEYGARDDGTWGVVGAPVLSDVELDFDGVFVEEVYPDPLPDLFAGTQLVIVGRYRDGGSRFPGSTPRLSPRRG